MKHLDKAIEEVREPHRIFTKKSWSDLNTGLTLPLSLNDIRKLRSLNDPISLEEVEQVYMPISRLLSFHVEAVKTLYERRIKFLNLPARGKTPFIIGIAGSVAVGKSTTARILKALLSRWPSSPKVDLVTTDGFLYPNAVLEKEGIMKKKGFPESYDLPALLRFLSDIKAGKGLVEAPVYSHTSYDVVGGEQILIEKPDILILEGLNVLQTRTLPKDGKAVPFVSDYFDFSIYIDAREDLISEWYIERFMQLRKTAFLNKKSYFYNVSNMPDDEAVTMAKNLWSAINKINLLENIQPTRPRANLILHKGDNHLVDEVRLRRL